MAKRKPGKKRPSKRKKVKPFVLNTTNLKFIGIAFDQAIADLKTIKTMATKKTAVTRLVRQLETLKLRTKEKCPQNWYVLFET